MQQGRHHFCIEAGPDFANLSKKKNEILTPLDAVHAQRGAQNVFVAGHQQLTRENKLYHLLRKG